MKTIAITIDEPTIERIDRLVGGSPARQNRSSLIREAVQDYLSRMERLHQEERERASYHQHRQLIARQLEALVKEQAEP